MENQKKSDILNRLSNMDTDQLSDLKDKKQVELLSCIKKLHLKKDELLILTFDSRKKLIEGGMTQHKADMELKLCPEIHTLKLEISDLAYEKAELKLSVDILVDYYWKAKQ